MVAGARTIDNLNAIEGESPVVVDLGISDGPGQLVKRAVDDHGRIDVLVNNVGGVGLRLKGFLGTRVQSWLPGRVRSIASGVSNASRL